MSRPRYGWWGYVRCMARRYPLRQGHILTSAERREQSAVERAVERTRQRPDGEDRLRLIDLVHFRRSHTLEGAATQIPCSLRTAQRWNAEFLREIARQHGLID